MKFTELKRFSGDSLSDVIRYLGLLASGIRDLFAGLYQLDFIDNFQSFEWSGIVVAGTEVAITNGLKTIPTRWIIADASGTNNVVRGDNTWTTKTLYVKNTAMISDATVKLVFFK